MDIVSGIKFVAKTAAYFGASAIVTNAVRALTPTTVSTFDKVCIYVGSFALTGIVASAASSQIDTDIDNVVKVGKAFKEMFDIAKDGSNVEGPFESDPHIVQEVDGA